MEKNYPKSFNNFYNKLLTKKKSVKTKNGINFYYWVDGADIKMAYDKDDSLGHYVSNVRDKEELYVDMLDHHLVPRVSEY